MAGWREDIVFQLKHTGRRLVLEVHLRHSMSACIINESGNIYRKHSRSVIESKNRLEGR